MQAANGGTVPSSASEHFDSQTATVPDSIDGAQPEGEIIPPGTPAPEEPPGWPVWDVQQIVALPFFFLENRFGDLWEISDKEAEHVAKVWKPILDRYLPLEETTLGTALIVTAAILAPRVMLTDWKNPKKQTPQASTKTAGSTGSPVTSANANPEKPAAWGVFSNP